VAKREKRMHGHGKGVTGASGGKGGPRGVRVALADCEAIFRPQEPNKRMRDKAAHACGALCRGPPPRVPARLRLSACQPGHGHAHPAGISWPSQHSAHRALRRTVAHALQEPLARRRRLPDVLGRLSAKTHWRTRQAQCGPFARRQSAGRPRPPKSGRPAGRHRRDVL
jgi:hypothetical protein